jgi:hypothetical protein
MNMKIMISLPVRISHIFGTETISNARKSHCNGKRVVIQCQSV